MTGSGWQRLARLGRPAPWLIVRPVWGLANRLRAVTSCQALAEQLGLRFGLLWEPGVYFDDTPWQELFANDLALVDRDHYARVRLGGAIDLGSLLGWGEERPPDPSFDPSRALGQLRRRGLCWSQGFHNVDKLLARRGVEGLERMRRRRHRACRRLRPAPAIARRVNAFADAHLRGRRVHGVHVRRGDAVRGPHAESYLRSPDEAFVADMERRLARDPELHFLLATDCQATEQKFRECFGERILSAEKRFVASEVAAPKGGQPEALVDLLLLARTEEVLGTWSSTFGRMAAHMGGVRFRAAGVAPGAARLRAFEQPGRQRSSASLSR